MFDINLNPEVAAALQSEDPTVVRAATKLIVLINACRTTEELNIVADAYPHIFFVEPFDERGISKVYGTPQRLKEIHNASTKTT
jgi:hypothetical protein